MRQGVDINKTDYDHRTALHIAASDGQVDICRMLVNAGADVSVRDR